MAADGDEDFSKLLLEERIVHKNWKARVSAYEALQKQFSAAVDDKDPIFAKYTGYLKNFVTESNVFALEKGLDAFVAFLTTGIISVKLFGAKVITVKSILKVALPLLEHRDKDVRENSKIFIVECFKWCGSAFKSQLESVKPILLHELEAEFAKFGSEVPLPTRYLRSQVQAAVSSDVVACESSEPVAAVVREEVDAWEFLDPVNVVAKLPSNFFDQLKSSKWLERKEILDMLATLIKANPRLDPSAQYGDIVSELKNAIGESDVEVRDAAASAIGTLMKTVGESTLKPFIAEIADDHLKMNKTIRQMEPKQVPVQAVVRFMAKKKEANFQILNLKFELYAYLATYCQFGPVAFRLCLAECLDKIADPKHNNYVSKVLSACAEALTLYHVADEVVRSAAIELVGILHWYIGSEIGMLFKSEKPAVLQMIETELKKSQSALNICQLIATSGGPTVREHVRIIVPGVIGLLTDSKPAIRQNALSVLNCWVEKTGIKELLTSEIIPNALTSDSPILRAELLAWLNGKLEAYQNKLPDADLKLTVPLVYSFVEDRNPEVRKQAQSILLPLARVLGYDFMKNAASKLKVMHVNNPTSINQIQALLEKIRPNIIQRAVSPDSPDVEVCSESVKRVGGRGNPSVTSGRAKTSVAQSKLLKWQFSIPSPDHVEQLKSQLSVVCKPELLQLLFHADFKLQLKAVEMLNQSLEQNNELTFNCLDLILKWCTLRFFETNPSVLMRCLDLIQSLLQMCVDRGYKMHDLEVASFLPYLLMKLGDQKDAVRTGAQNLVGIIASLSSPCKIFPYLIESCKVKNSRQRAQCLTLMGSMISTEGLSVCGSPPQAALKAIAAYIGDRDRLDFKWNVEALGFDPDENISLCSLELIEEDVDCTPFVYEFKAHKYESKITDQSVHISAALDAAIRQIISSDLSSSTLALLQIISVEELSKEISPEAQKNLLAQLLATLSFSGMNSLPESSNIQSSINLYGMKMMELYDPTKCVCALISLLRDTLRDGNNKADIIGCVLRLLKQIEDEIENSANSEDVKILRKLRQCCKDSSSASDGSSSCKTHQSTDSAVQDANAQVKCIIDKIGDVTTFREVESNTVTASPERLENSSSAFSADNTENSRKTSESEKIESLKKRFEAIKKSLNIE
ncbi:putative HEAT repeat-containing domain protein [Trichinella spiralis]|uniref:putative HEAT repeat-containing domain protein n=1 Tax=Trichinella spiralis TaxID=6334 RepID=UPI0001EFECF9|nr:putative HEAT repeat-containing domain protein [Trichinella spiralis]